MLIDILTQHAGVIFPIQLQLAPRIISRLAIFFASNGTRQSFKCQLIFLARNKLQLKPFSLHSLGSDGSRQSLEYLETVLLLLEVMLYICLLATFSCSSPSIGEGHPPTTGCEGSCLLLE